MTEEINQEPITRFNWRAPALYYLHNTIDSLVLFGATKTVCSLEESILFTAGYFLYRPLGDLMELNLLKQGRMYSYYQKFRINP